jgi:intracellular septation protein A
MTKIKLAFSIFWRFILILYVLIFLINAFMSLIEGGLIQQMGSMYIKLKPTVAYFFYAICLIALTNIKFLRLNSFVWKRVFSVPLSWITCYKIYAIVCVALSVVNLLFALLASDEAWVNYKLLSVFAFFFVPIALAYKLDEIKTN